PPEPSDIRLRHRFGHRQVDGHGEAPAGFWQCVRVGCHGLRGDARLWLLFHDWRRAELRRHVCAHYEDYGDSLREAVLSTAPRRTRRRRRDADRPGASRNEVELQPRELPGPVVSVLLPLRTAGRDIHAGVVIMPTAIELRRLEFDARQRTRELRLRVFEARKLEAMPELVEAERELQSLSDQRAAAEKTEGIDNGSIVNVRPQGNLLGPTTTGLDVKVNLRMSSVATSLVHLWTSTDQPLVSYDIRTTSGATKRLRLISFVEGFSAQAVETVEVEHLENVTRAQMPTFFSDRIGKVTELNRATVNVEVQDLDAKTEVHRTIPIWLLARS